MHLGSVKINHSLFPAKDCYPFNLLNLNSTKDLQITNSTTIFAGENGSGKSTLLTAIARNVGIYIWNDEAYSPFKRNPFSKSLYKFIELEWKNGKVHGAFFSAQNFRRYAELVDEWARDESSVLQYFGGESMLSKSHGQTNMQFFEACFQRKGLFLLDEPEAALSPKTQFELLEIISDSSQHYQAQFIIATHSPILMSIPGATIFSFDLTEIVPVSFTDTNHYKMYKAFFEKY